MRIMVCGLSMNEKWGMEIMKVCGLTYWGIVGAVLCSPGIVRRGRCRRRSVGSCQIYSD